MSFQRYERYKDSGVEWLGQVPEHWEVHPARFVVRHVDKRNENAECQDYLSLMANVGVIPYAEKGDIGNKKPEDLSKRKIVEVGDIVINSMNYNIGSYGISSYEGVCSPVYVVLKVKEEITFRRFAFRIFQNTAFRQYAASFGNGILAHRAAIGWDDIKVIGVAVPSLKEQEKIFIFLDEETAKIDALIEEQRRLIELLKEKRQAVISRAVTKGLNPAVLVKDSSVSWLGTVPKHWSVSPISYFCERLSYGFTNPMPTADDGPYLLTANDVGDGKIRYESARRTTWEAFANELTEKSKPQANDILITKDGTLGRIALYDGQEACINQSVAALKVNPSMVRPAFIALSLTGDLYQARMIYDAGGTTIKHIYISRLSKMPMAYPEINEQDQIIEYLKKIVRSSASAVADAESVVSLLQERRSALISAAVTGKIDVRNYTPKEAA